MSRRTLLEVTAVILFGAVGAADAASPYTLKIAAKTGDTIGGKTFLRFAPPVINAGGTVAFFAEFTDLSEAIITAQLFAGTPGQANCHGASVSALSQEFGGIDAGLRSWDSPACRLSRTPLPLFANRRLGVHCQATAPQSPVTEMGFPSISDEAHHASG